MGENKTKSPCACHCSKAFATSGFLLFIRPGLRADQLYGVKTMNYVDRATRLGFCFSTELIHILLISSFLLWLVFGIWLYDKKNYGVSFFCCLAQLIVLIGYEGMMLSGHDPDMVRATVFIANWIVCAVVFIISMLMVIFHERKQDTIAWGLSVLQSLCYLWSFIIYLAQNAD